MNCKFFKQVKKLQKKNTKSLKYNSSWCLKKLLLISKLMLGKVAIFSFKLNLALTFWWFLMQEAHEKETKWQCWWRWWKLLKAAHFTVVLVFFLLLYICLLHVTQLTHLFTIERAFWELIVNIEKNLLHFRWIYGKTLRQTIFLSLSLLLSFARSVNEEGCSHVFKRNIKNKKKNKKMKAFFSW